MKLLKKEPISQICIPIVLPQSRYHAHKWGSRCTTSFEKIVETLSPHATPSIPIRALSVRNAFQRKKMSPDPRYYR